jgi:hypothetical protein
MIIPSDNVSNINASVFVPPEKKVVVLPETTYCEFPSKPFCPTYVNVMLGEDVLEEIFKKDALYGATELLTVNTTEAVAT